MSPCLCPFLVERRSKVSLATKLASRSKVLESLLVAHILLYFPCTLIPIIWHLTQGRIYGQKLSYGNFSLINISDIVFLEIMYNHVTDYVCKAQTQFHVEFTSVDL